MKGNDSDISKIQREISYIYKDIVIFDSFDFENKN